MSLAVATLAIGLTHALSSLAEAASAAAGPAAPHTQLLEYLPSPVLGIDVPMPRFSWMLSDEARAVSSAAYQVAVTTKVGGAVWDSSKTEGDASKQIECGAALKADTPYEWKVRWWSAMDASAPLPYSAPASFHTGPMALADWHGALSIDSAATPPPAPSPGPKPGTICNTPAGRCQMVSTTELMSGKEGYFHGSYEETVAHAAKDIPGCIAACEKDNLKGRVRENFLIN